MYTKFGTQRPNAADVQTQDTPNVYSTDRGKTRRAGN